MVAGDPVILQTFMYYAMTIHLILQGRSLISCNFPTFSVLSFLRPFAESVVLQITEKALTNRTQIFGRGANFLSRGDAAYVTQCEIEIKLRVQEFRL